MGLTTVWPFRRTGGAGRGRERGTMRVLLTNKSSHFCVTWHTVRRLSWTSPHPPTDGRNHPPAMASNSWIEDYLSALMRNG